MIQIDQLRFGYSRSKILFDQLNLSLEAGHVYGLLGKNGAGKSTLLKNIAGLSRPLSGRVRLNGLDVSRRPVSVLQELYFVPEEIYLPDITLARYLKQTAIFYPHFDQNAFWRYLGQFEVEAAGSMADRSYGQQKKILIAFGLASNVSQLIMDEPTNGLDIPSKVQFRKLIAANQSESRSILISTHQVRDLDQLIDRLLVLHDRQILIDASLDTIEEKLLFGYFPDTTGLSILYEEQSYQGSRAILPNEQGLVSKADMELLFNAIAAGNQSIPEYLKKNQ